MATSFEAMMSLAREKAQANQASVEATIRQKEYKERERRAKQEEIDRKQREMEAKMRQRHFENQKKEEERKRKEEKQREEAEAARERREAQIREEILHGKKSAPRAGGGTRTAGVKRSRSLDVDSGPATFLTREEKRARKESAFFDAPSAKATKSTQRPRAKLPGGALNTVGGSASSSATKGNTRQRLMKAPNTLVKLNQVKRDTRTIDEIVTDIAHKKSGGAESSGNTDFFGNKKSGNLSQSMNANTRPAAPSRSSSSTMVSKPKPAGASSRPVAKHSRRDSRSQSPPRRRADYDDDIGHENITDLVRGLYGRRPSYNHDVNVYSDDEDMEADFLDVHAEEERSARLAREEDARALAEEKRHEEEKRRKRMAGKR